ncbi:MAG: glycerol-3-phosphate 1-O-acyltransferase PlsY [Ignavibacteria bacterium]|nr:glycerol-3-phosphate 1-O-acyltransferase PlsY [Ignavibacteria bacterium]
MFYFVLGIVLSYLLGSFPTAVVVSKVFFGFDIRTRGSGNMGSTNAFRQLGVFWGIVVQIVDILKGFIPTFFFPKVIIDYFGKSSELFWVDELVLMFIFGFSAIAGHIWSVFVGFKGGKGINTALGMLLAISPLEVLICLGVFLLAFLSTGIVSIGSILASFVYPLVIIIRYMILNHEYSNFPLLLIFSFLLFVLILFTHRANIRRIINGTENKFEQFKIFRMKKRK